ncbi:hypothetical protein IC229_03615 [Spirosoma sp. BT702]|uniref:DUF3108 domain-containing protein n=1 Tax=Spirosoma profusum TaxID=2771354 RepID=A0A926Y0U8_9BACT|nr:hypothetical protein [Spirosoma profusum]MBD2699711.1 hypothetical protein [Spirosoma profusum]
MRLFHLLTAISVASLFMTTSNAQPTPKSLAGEYYLRGVQEVGSGIKLNDDFTFEFFFVYGALDRFGKGTWKLQGKQVILTSSQRPPKDFALVTSKTVPGNKLTIRIVDPNTNLLRHVESAVKNGTDVQRQITNEKGEVSFLKQPQNEAISLRFEFAPERYSVFPITNKAHNYYEFRFEPWIMDVFFENQAYTLSDDGLEGLHPLLEPGKSYSFERE